MTFFAGLLRTIYKHVIKRIHNENTNIQYSDLLL